jgi:membrane dipeptidase
MMNRRQFAGFGAAAGIEGGDALEGRLRNLDAFHDEGVRMMTLVHDRDNEIGCNQRSGTDGPLSRFGVQVVERMNSLGMLVDVAHAKGGTLKGIAEVCARPLVDSHTSPLAPGEDGPGLRRLRPWPEMELIAKTGGIVCTWPFAYAGNRSQRTTLGHWAREIAEMKRRLGIEHCGLGTDGGGGLPRLVEGWSTIDSLPGLMAAMRDAGLTPDDIAAFVGGNLLRLLEGCLA